MEFGVYTFADMTPDHTSGGVKNAQQRMSDLLEEIALADQLGLDVFGLGEHHRPEYAISAPAVVMAAAAAVTKHIRLTSAVTVLSSDDPVRVFQSFATVDLLSKGRAEIMVGRGSFIESFPLFGYSLQEYDSLFSEKLDLLLKINGNEKVTWSGNHRAPIKDLGVYPRPIQETMPVWIAVGGTPASAVRAAKLGLPMALAIIGGMPERFAPFVQLYRNEFAASGHSSLPRIGINSHAYIADTSQRAGDEFFKPYAAMMNHIGKERGWSGIAREDFEAMRSARGALLVGSVQQVVDKILFEHELFGHTRFLAQMSLGTMPHDRILRSMELFGTRVVPEVRKHLFTAQTEKDELTNERK